MSASANHSLLILPTGALTEGILGPFQVPALPRHFSGYRLEVEQSPDWPTSGDVLTVLIEHSDDGGKTWIGRNCATFGAAPWSDETKSLITTGYTQASLGATGGTADSEPVHVAISADDLFRITLDVLQPCSPVITFFGVP